MRYKLLAVSPQIPQGFLLLAVVPSIELPVVTQLVPAAVDPKTVVMNESEPTLRNLQLLRSVMNIFPTLFTKTSEGWFNCPFTARTLSTKPAAPIVPAYL